MERGEETVKHVESPQEAKQEPSYYQALVELLYQLADDDLLMSFRGSEWLGLAPHIEADLAFSSITQNTMGHAAMYYQLLDDLGEGDGDLLAHARPANERCNAIYLEKRNGDGEYWEEPYYDWALAVVRNYFYEAFKKAKLKAVANSSYRPLADVAKKVQMEQTYHLAHWKMWIKQLQHSTDEGKRRIQERVEEAWTMFKDVLSLGEQVELMEGFNLVTGEESINIDWMQEVEDTLIRIPTAPLGSVEGHGRHREHTTDLHHALETMAEVYNSDREAVW